MKYSIIIFSLIFLFSCSEDKGVNNSTSSSFDFVKSSFPDSTVKELLLNSIDEVNAIQSLNYIEKNWHQSINQDGNEFVEAHCFYEVDGRSKEIEYSKVEGQDLKFYTNYLAERYQHKWNEDNLLETGTDIEFEFNDGNNIVHDTVHLPNSFGDVLFSEDSLDIDSSITLTWEPTSNSSGEIAIKSTFLSVDSTIGIPHNGDPIIIKDTGSYTFTSEYLKNELNISDEKSVLFITLIRGNGNLKEYANKKAATYVWIEKTIGINTK